MTIVTSGQKLVNASTIQPICATSTYQIIYHVNIRDMHINFRTANNHSK